jgi:hypothetical protein
MDAADVVAASGLLMKEAPTGFTSRQVGGAPALPAGNLGIFVHLGS